jgi:hydroxymethylglutaryl-CoA lyase
MSRLPTHVTLCEVGPRDGLQNEKELVSTAHKLELIERLQAAGVRRLEATSFVSPKWVPQMADNGAVMPGMNAGLRRPEVAYAVLVPNAKGLEAALPLKPDEIVVFTAASRGLCAARTSTARSTRASSALAPVIAEAKAQGIKVRAALSCCDGLSVRG